MTSQEIGKIMEALAKAQGEIRGAKEDSSNPFYKSAYADLSSVWRACREPLTKNGLAVTQVLEITDKGQALRTILGHSSGEWIDSIVLFPLDIKDPQAMGKVITYYRRYALASIVGVCPEDDDAEGAMQTHRQPHRQEPEAKPQGRISAEQAKSLEAMISPDDAGYKQWLLKKFEIMAFAELPLDKYQHLYNTVKKRSEEKLKEEMKKKPEDEMPF